jgi:O-antigen ligase
MRFLLVAYGIFLPFQWALQPVAGIDLAGSRVATLIIGIYWCTFSLFRKKVWLPRGLAVLFFCSFLFVAACSLVWAENGIFAVRKVLFLLSFAPLFFVAASWLQERPKEIFLVVRALVLGAFAMSIVALVLFFLQFVFGVANVFSVLTSSILPVFLGTSFGQAVASYPSLLVNISGHTLLRASGVFPDPHMLSYYMGMAIPLAIYSAYKKRNIFWLVVVGTLLLADLLSFSRGGYIGLVAGLGVFALPLGTRLFTGDFWKTSRRRIVAVGLVAIVAGSIFSPLGGRIQSIFSQQDGSNIERLRLWQEALGHISTRPFLGVGLGNYPLLVKPGVSYREPIYAHNLYLDITLELGVLGLLCFLGLCGSILWRLGKIYTTTGDAFPLALLASLTVFLGHSFFETPLFSVHILSLLFLLFAIGVSYQYDEAHS